MKKKNPMLPPSWALGSIAFDLDQHPPLDFLGRPFSSEEVEKMKALLRQDGGACASRPKLPQAVRRG